MKTKTSSPSRSVPGISLTAFGSLGLALALSSCGTVTSQSALTSPNGPSPSSVESSPPTQVAVVDVTPSNEHRDRIRGSQLIAVNGKPASASEINLPAGSNEMTLSYHLPQGGKQEVTLNFEARANQRYFVKYRAFPPTNHQARSKADAWVGACNRSGYTDLVGRMADPGAPEVAWLVGAPLVAGVLGLGAVDAVQNLTLGNLSRVHSIQKAQYVDVFLISEDGAEGVVQRVRAYADGQVDNRPANSKGPGTESILRPEQLAANF